MKKFPIYSKYAVDIFVKHESESRCVVVDLLEGMEKIQIIDNGKMSSFHYDNFVMGKCDNSTEEEFFKNKKKIIELI